MSESTTTGRQSSLRADLAFSETRGLTSVEKALSHEEETFMVITLKENSDRVQFAQRYVWERTQNRVRLGPNKPDQFLTEPVQVA